MELAKIKGTKDIFGKESLAWQKIESLARKTAYSFHLSEIRTPAFEYTDVFKRAIGQETDIVSKEMFEFSDRGGRNLSLRPEGTAGVVRALIENSLYRTEIPRFFYIGPMFRAERPQKGRQRQFHQIGIEIFDEPSAYADLDVILFNLELLASLGLNDFVLKLNSVGCPNCRPSYLQKLKTFLEPHLPELCPNCQTRFQSNPLRVLDCKEEKCRNITKSAPSILDALCDECAGHFNLLKKMLANLQVPFELDTSIVRGLDYYTKTVFEIQLSGLGAQNAVCGGGRYDGLVSFFDPKVSLPAVGSAIGFERLFLALESAGILPQEDDSLDFYLIVDPKFDKTEILPVLREIRKSGFSARMDESSKNIGKQFKEANRLNSKKTLIFGEDELKTGKVSVKDMKSGAQNTVTLEVFLHSLVI